MSDLLIVGDLIINRDEDIFVKWKGRQFKVFIKKVVVIDNPGMAVGYMELNMAGFEDKHG